MKILKVVLTLALAISANVSAQAGIETVLNGLGGSGAGSHTQDAASRSFISFDVDGNSTGTTFKLNKIRADMGVTASGDFAIKMGLYDALNPLNLIAESDAVSINSAGGAENRDFRFSSDPVLSAGTYYILPSQVGGGLFWNHAQADPLAPFSPDIAYGGSQSTFSGFPAGFTDDQPMRFALYGEIITNGGQVPEPALTSLLCLGGVALIRRRMKK